MDGYGLQINIPLLASLSVFYHKSSGKEEESKESRTTSGFHQGLKGLPWDSPPRDSKDQGLKGLKGLRESKEIPEITSYLTDIDDDIDDDDDVELDDHDPGSLLSINPTLSSSLT